MKKFLNFAILFTFILTANGQDNLQPKRVVTTVGEYFGYVNQSGVMVIPARFKEAYRFYNGIARVMNDANLYGFINEKGEEVIPFKYSHAGDFGRNSSYDEIVPTQITTVGESFVEEYTKKPNLGEVFYTGQSSTAKRTITKSGIINLNGTYIVPLSFAGESRVEGDFALIRFTKDRQLFSALIDAEGNTTFGPVNGEIHLTTSNIIIRYNNALETNGQPDAVSEMFDMKGNLLVGVENGYWGFSETGNPRFLESTRNVMVGDKVVMRSGLIDLQGNEIVQTLFERIIWESDLMLFKIIIKSDNYNEIFFYADQNGKCIAKPKVPCPAPPPDGFDYNAYISKGHHLKNSFKQTTSIPLETQANASLSASAGSTVAETTKPVGTNAENAGEGQVYSDMKGVWVNTPPPPQDGTIFKINTVQKNAICGDFKKFMGGEISAEAKLRCIHADENGYVFYLEYYKKPSWYSGKHYLHVAKKEKNGEFTYKVARFNDFIDTSFEKQKLLYNKYVTINELGNKGYSPSWWFWSVFN